MYPYYYTMGICTESPQPVGGISVNTDFPRILTLLRKERGISQKQAASELGISQALLSHYEKGIRECGLDFVVRTANFYEVSCDYLLGRSPERTGATLSLADLPENENKDAGANLLTGLNKRLINNSIQIIFELLQKMDEKRLTNAVSNHLMLSTYAIFRTLYSINPKNDVNLFTVPYHQVHTMSFARMLEAQAQITALLENSESKKDHKLDREVLAISSDSLQQEYPLFTSSLLNLVKQTEVVLNS